MTSDPKRTSEEQSLVGRGGTEALSSPNTATAAVRRRRAYTLIWLTQFAPGSAQLVGGNKRLGRFVIRLLILFVLAAAVIIGLFFYNRAFVINTFARPPVLWGLAAVVLACAVGWAWLFIDAVRLSRPGTLPKRTRLGVSLLAAMLMVISCGTLTWSANVIRVGASAVSGMFGTGMAAKPVQGRYNILLLGGDSGASREGLRPDTIMLASIDADSGRTAMFGFARDTENINFRPGTTMSRLMPQGWNCGDKCLLNGLYTWAHQNASKFPANSGDVGVLATKEAIESLSGIDIQYYALVDLKGFQRFIDAVGGIDVDVRKATPIGGGTSRIKGYIQPGHQHLDGYHALWYARSREGSSNYERMQRQQCVMTSMLHQLDPATVITKYQELAGAAGSTLGTDIPASQLGTMSDLAIKARDQKMTSVNFTPPIINPWKYDPQVIRNKVAEAIAKTERAGESASSSSRASSTSRASASHSPHSTNGLKNDNVISPRGENIPGAPGQQRATGSSTSSAHPTRGSRSTTTASPRPNGSSSASTGMTEDLAAVCSAG
ncbi:LCP family protein [Dermatophilus congolensis]|uniref:LCP family protein n=1 Tax=Dermatophilus congolensis TaxID=1863 RepID=UPI000E0E2819|nr:LCP family protein [Dermatophilus congolensis]